MGSARSLEGGIGVCDMNLPSNIDWITEDLALGGVFSIEAAGLLAKAGIRGVVDMRDEAAHDARALRRHGIALLALPTPDRHGPSQRALDEGADFAQAIFDAGGRVLVHCHYGIGRSATLGLAILVARGMAPLEALLLAKNRREAVSPSPDQYEAWRAWLDRHRAVQDVTWDPPPFDDFAAIAYRHLARQ